MAKTTGAAELSELIESVNELIESVNHQIASVRAATDAMYAAIGAMATAMESFRQGGRHGDGERGKEHPKDPYRAPESQPFVVEPAERGDAGMSAQQKAILANAWRSLGQDTAGVTEERVGEVLDKAASAFPPERCNELADLAPGAQVVELLAGAIKTLDERIASAQKDKQPPSEADLALRRVLGRLLGRV